MQKGFITIPILIIALFGTVIVGGGGYAVYKVNQVQKESNQRVVELEKKIEEVSTTQTLEESVELAEVATNTEEITDEVKAVETSTVERTVTPRLTPVTQSAVAPAVQPMPNPDFSQVVTVTLDNAMRDAENLLKLFPIVYELLDFEKQRFIKIRNETVANMRNLGMTDTEINNMTLIKFYGQYIDWTDEKRAGFKVYEDTTYRLIGNINLARNEAKIKTFKTLEEANSHVSYYYSYENVLWIANGVDEKYYQTRDFMFEMHDMLRSLSSNSASVSSPKVPTLNIPKITSTHCTVNFGNISCDTIGY